MLCIFVLAMFTSQNVSIVIKETTLVSILDYNSFNKKDLYEKSNSFASNNNVAFISMF